MSTGVFAGHNQEQLDALLDTRRRVPDHASYADRFERRSERVRQESTCELDVRYGEHPRERLDLFWPARSGPVPINLFFHGGYWRSGAKERYSFLAETFTSAGVACAIVEYALCPAVALDELIRQCRAAVASVFYNADRFGVDRASIYVSGHSAGGQIVGMLMAEGWQQPLGLPASVVRGGCGVSGLYDLEPIRLSYLNADLGLSAEVAERNSPSRLRPAGPAALIASVGELEGEEFLRQNATIAQAWGPMSTVTPMVLDGLHHYSAVEALGDPGSRLARAVLEQMAVGPSRRRC
jgi:arylformamidase